MTSTLRVRDNEIINNGLGRKLVKNGFYDFKVNIGGDEVKSVKILFMCANQTFRKLLEDKEFNGTLELAEGCTQKGFLELEKYYSSGDMQITKENVCEVLMMSICYNDELIKLICTEYIKNYHDDEVIINLIGLTNRFPDAVYDLQNLASVEYEKIDKWLTMLDINNLEYLFSSSSMIIRNETWLLNRLLKWYSANRNKNDIKSDFKILLENHFHDDQINKSRIDSKYKDTYKELNININVNKCINYIDLYTIDNEKIQDIIVRYYCDDIKLQLDEDDIKVLKIINKQKIVKNLLLLIQFKDVKVNEIGIMIIMANIFLLNCI